MANLGAATLEEVQPHRCVAFAGALEGSGHGSVDAFLNSNRHELGFNNIGKGATAQVLLEYEQQVAAHSNDDWLSYLFKVMLDGVTSPEEFAHANNVTFITFNYDRLLERWLLNRLKCSFGLDHTTAMDALRTIPIHHVYGMLGPFPDDTLPDPRAWVDASQGIRSIFDAEQDRTILDAVNNRLASAQVICILGFGFHSENIRLLDLVGHSKRSSVLLASSRFDFFDAEWRRLSSPFPTNRILACSRVFKCLSALRNLDVF